MSDEPSPPPTASGPSDLLTQYTELVRMRGGRGLLITLEGIDGCGKSTQHSRLAERLKAQGLPVVVSREPTSGPHGRHIRQLLSRPEAPDLTMAHRLRDLFLADRKEHVAKLIEPALKTGVLVLLDRYYHSSIAYQGAAGLDPDEVRTLNEAVAPAPDLVLLFDLPVEEAAQRLQDRDSGAAAVDTTDGFEVRIEYQEAVRRQYLAMAGWHNVKLVDGARNVDDLEQICNQLIHVLFSTNASTRSQLYFPNGNHYEK